MKVIGHENASWFLFEDMGDYYLDVNSGYSFVGYSICFKLNQDEISDYNIRKEKFVSDLAQRVNYSQKTYLERQNQLSSEIQEKMASAIQMWKASNRS